MRAWMATVVAGLLLGYSSRPGLRLQCRGVLFGHLDRQPACPGSGSGAAFAGSWLGIRLRPHLGLEART
ncbi:MAG: hypothetical protein R3D61_05430 [Defluviimonas denitrificans]